MRRVLAVGVAAVMAACGGSDDGGSTGSLQVFPASFDLAAGQPSRFLAGVSTGRNLFVSGGSVGMRFFFLGEDRVEGEPEPAGQATATFLPIPGEEDEAAPPTPRAVAGDAARGVYRVEEMTFDRPGFWEVEVAARIDGRMLTGRGAFEVLPEPQVPLPGDPAPRTENLTVDSRDAPEEAIDSRAVTEGSVPDPELHATTIAEAIEAGRPVLAVFATPVYCVSKFCGPVTDMVAELADEYGDRAEFVHVEIWRDFQGR
ncbi:MAG TPA: hypothetical protein VHH92_00480, partial [Actinomycetota bacterium]|nr:hypothetical protein [Actinomycetota bacterium]